MRQYVLLDGLRCVECGRYDQSPPRGWRAYHGRDEPEDELEVFVFCPECSLREFLDCEDGRRGG